jgi:two-component system invasion response regulator UvrY
MINVLIADDHELVRRGIKRILEDIEGINVIAEAGTGEDAVRLVRRHGPHVVLMDVSMPGIGGLEATRKIVQVAPDTRVIVVTIFMNDPYPIRLLEAGAAGYLTKGSGVEDVVTAIRTVHAGKRYLGTDIARQLAFSALPGSESSPFELLSQRELQVMMMLTHGQNNRQISESLCLSPKTVSTYRYRLYEKLGVGNDVELTHMAIRHGVLEKNVSLA